VHRLILRVLRGRNRDLAGRLPLLEWAAGEYRPPHVLPFPFLGELSGSPYRYCNVLDHTDGQNPQTQGQLPVNSHDPVQLSVPTAIGRAPWWLLRVYEDSVIPATTFYRPGSRLAVTIPTVDPHHGRLTGFAVQLMTVVVDRSGELQGVPHAEWSVRTVWG
jgi:hypothetical protein